MPPATWCTDGQLIAAGYLVINLGYSLGLKRVSIVDVMLIALGFVLRVEAGATLIHVEASAWILICTGLLALFLALGKRRDDLVRDLGGAHRRSLDGYSKPFLDMAVSITLGALLVAYLIYTTDAGAMARLGTGKLFYTAPFVVAGILRYLQIMLVEQRSGSPTLLVTTDRFLIVTILGWVTTFALLIYV
jgi:4-hydroxybenzoate polyprenyltransferase